jgi:uncharacterized membrane protein YgcG
MAFTIVPERAVIHENVLNILGAQFQGDHARGLAEWMKNSADAYIREDVPDEQQHIILHLTKRTQSKPATFACIDFVGATFEEVDQALKVWCNPDAASRGQFSVYGGHGNGGKFYMRQMFALSYFVTYRDGRLTVFGFDKKKQYGFTRGYKGAKVSPQEAMRRAQLNLAWLPPDVRERFQKGDVRFTVVWGVKPDRLQRVTYPSIWEKLQRYPQSRQLLARSVVKVLVDGKVEVGRLLPPEIPPKIGFEEPVVIDIPATINHEGQPVQFDKTNSTIGKLILRTSAEPFSFRAENSILNAVDIRGRVGVIASYRMRELPIHNPNGAQFIYGECQCPILEDLGCKQNDRSKLNEDNEYSEALLTWIAQQVDALAAKMIEEADRKRSEEADALTSYFNKLLNSWKNQFLQRFFVEVTAGPGTGTGAGGAGGGGGGTGGGGGGGGGGRAGEGGEGGGGAGEKTRRAPRFPLVLVSGVDPDPATGQTIVLDPRQDIIYQRPEDVLNNIWWINAQRPLAQKIRQEERDTSPRWRDYMFQRYIDIILNYTITERWKQEEPSPDAVQQWIQETLKKAHDSAANELTDFPFGEPPSNGEE